MTAELLVLVVKTQVKKRASDVISIAIASTGYFGQVCAVIVAGWCNLQTHTKMLRFFLKVNHPASWCKTELSADPLLN